MKFLILVLVVFAVLWALRSLHRRIARREPRRDEARPAVGHEDLPACAHCGVYLPRSEALAGPDGVFCSEAHRVAFRSRKTPA